MFARRYRRDGLELDDLIQIANEGLMVAVRVFDQARGTFHNCADFNICSMLSAHVMRNTGIVRTGTTAAKKKIFRQLGLAKAEIGAYQAAALEPAQLTYVAKRLGVTEEDVVSMECRLSGRDRSLSTPIDYKDGTVGELGQSLHEISATDETASLGNFDLKLWQSGHEQAGTLIERRKNLSAALEQLPDREREIFIARNLTDDPVTLDALAERFDLSRERVRQIEKRALKRITEIMTAMEWPSPPDASDPHEEIIMREIGSKAHRADALRK